MYRKEEGRKTLSKMFSNPEIHWENSVLLAYIRNTLHI